MRSMCSLSFLLIILMVLFIAGGCSRDTAPLATDSAPGVELSRGGVNADADAPSGLVSVTHGGETLTFWPYLTPNGTTPEDPVSLVLAGTAGPLEIRAALMALDGNRSGAGLPPLGTWSDAVGGVQAAYVDGVGWVGGVIQLSLGQYGPFRVHLRLFDTGQAFGEDGKWTLGGAHMEIQIPGTPEHQVLAWENAEQLVLYDLARAGLFQSLPGDAGLINAAPGFRYIPPVIYNGVPDPVKQLCGLPTGSTSVPVLIPNNGHATVASVAYSGGIGGGTSQSFTVPFEQTIPKPFCAAGPSDYYVVTGSVDIHKNVRVEGGRLTYQSSLTGELTATSIGGGEPFKVRVHDIQNGFTDGDHSLVNSSVKRIAPQDGGSELLMQRLLIGGGNQQFSELQNCLTD